MGIAIVKKLNTHMPESIKVMLAPWIRRKLINNREFQRQTQALIEAEKSSALDQVHFNLLKQTLIHAYEHTKYYKELFQSCGFDVYTFSDVSEMQRIPILTKQDIMTHFAELQADDVDDFYAAITGGSTGKPLKILVDKQSIYRERAFIYHYWSHFGFDYTTSRLVTFRGLEFHNKLYKQNPVYNEIQLNPFLLSTKTMLKYLTIIDRFHGDFLQGYPSTIYSFCCFLEQMHIELKNPFKAVFLISENVYPFQEERIQKTLHCKCCAFYGHSERAVFAYQAEDGDYAFNGLYGYPELQPDGKLLCTGYINRKMPLIRYDTEDTAEYTNHGRYKIYGHHGKEILFGKNGEEISASPINFHSKAMLGVGLYQFIQDEIGQARLLLVSENGEPLDVQSIQNTVQKKLGDVLRITAEQTEKVELTARGKYRMIVQNLKPENNQPIEEVNNRIADGR